MKYNESQALAKAAAYCSKAERAEHDVRQKLIGWELEDEPVKNIIDRLKKEKFLDEERFCTSFIKDKMRFNKWGKIKIVFELKKKYVSASVIASCFGNIESDDFQDSLLKILFTKNKTIKAETHYDRRNKLIRFALGRGFSYEQINISLLKILGKSEDEYFE